jgi:hypothetical protein
VRIVVGSDAFGTNGGTHGTRSEIDVRAHRGIVSRMVETKTLAYSAADRHPQGQDRGRPDLNSSIASFQSPSGDIAIPLI